MLPTRVPGRRLVNGRSWLPERPAGLGQFFTVPRKRTGAGDVLGEFFGCFFLVLLIGLGIPRVVDVCRFEDCDPTMACVAGTLDCEVKAQQCHCNFEVDPASTFSPFPNWRNSIVWLALLVAAVQFSVRYLVGFYADADLDSLFTIALWLMAFVNRDQPFKHLQKFFALLAQWAGCLAGALVVWAAAPSGQSNKAWWNGGFSLGASDIAFNDLGEPPTAPRFYLTIFLGYTFFVFGYLGASHQFQASGEAQPNKLNSDSKAPRTDNEKVPAYYTNWFSKNVAILFFQVIVVLAVGADVGPIGMWSREFSTFWLVNGATTNGGPFPLGPSGRFSTLGVTNFVGYLLIPLASMVAAVIMHCGWDLLSYRRP